MSLEVRYKEHPLSTAYRADFVCYDEVIVEVKALERLSGREVAQLLNCLKATGFRRGLVLNFGAPKLQIKRLVR